ncbi:GAF domain-containing sensor histidine kinase [Microlunatus capsulatus]|uniref:Signal transduction histidine kinase n=1 Tax=Microlunatus capsulatus TaxID=99117 RepID=A0ABS4Z5U4_9ACTN|nr:GAF domain-containing protein [Microlunatus capsulatus]MBP2416411.1 signal transduction histidine kinase [Microlunatus capsulatus]
MLDGTEATRDSPEVRLQKLVEANHAIVAELSLDGLLRRVVESAREIVGAEFAALGVVGRDGLLEQFIHCGMDVDVVETIGELPKGRGLLGALLERPEPIRLRALADDPRSSGVPDGHPPIDSFLGVPIRSASSVYGNLYLTNRIGQPEFSAEDQNLVTALAATASIAVENARLHAQSQRRQDWLRASAEVSHRLLASVDEGPVLAEVATSVRRLTGADAVAILLPAADDPDQLVMEVVDGGGAEGLDRLRGLRVPVRGSQVQRVMQEERSRVLEGFEERVAAIGELGAFPAIRHVVALPLQGTGRPRGAIVAVRMVDEPFSPDDLELADGFVSQAGLALELADARTDHHKLAMLEDRARIARDLHDHVVQKLFAAGLTLQGTATMVGDADLRRRLAGAVDNLDDTIRTIRTSIFELQEPNLPGASVRSRVMRVLGEMTPVLGFAPLLSFDGPLDTVVDESLGHEVEAVLRESLTNAAKHARAGAVAVRLVTAARTLTLTVADDGVGLRPSARRSGLSNLRFRAEQRGGRLELERAPEGGLLVRWSIPLPG